MLQKVRKEIIRYSLDFDILNLQTYSGYKGDLLVKITMPDSDDATLRQIRQKALELGMDVAIKDNKHYMIYELYCITPDDTTYGLKL
jgi:hypothetical protein